jgi:hypothetical protein
MSMGRAPRVYQESGGVAGEIAPLRRALDMGAIGKKPEMCQNKANGIPPSVTFTHTPLNTDKSRGWRQYFSARIHR